MLAFIAINLIASLIIYIVFKNIRKNLPTIKETLLTLVIAFLVNTLPALLIPSAEFGSIIFNIILAILLTIIAYDKIKNFPLSALYAILTVIIILLSANLINILITLAHLVTQGYIGIGRSTVEGSNLFLASYLILIFISSYVISRQYGHYLNKKISSFDEMLKRKLALYLLYGAAITLSVFFILTFLRYLLASEAVLILIYALALTTSFTYLMFATFTFAEKTRMEVELRHKEEMMRNLQFYTDQMDRITTEMRLFRHDHLNLLLGFREHIENKNLGELRKYYDKYMDSFSQTVAIKDAIAKKLKNIQVPELNSILLAKYVQAQQQKTEMWIETDETIFIHNIEDVLLDLCRMVGIFMDNALEHCKDVKGTEVRFLAMNKDEHVVFVFENTCQTQPFIYELSTKGFSTKGDGRGLGLYNANQIVAKNQRILLNTFCQNGYFTQKLTVLAG